MNSTSQPSIVFITAHQHLPIKLTSSNFPSWRAHLTALLNGFNLMHHLNTHPLPDDNTTAWFQQDQLLLAAIFGSLSPEILPHVPSSTTSAAHAYSTLANFFATKSRARFMEIKDELVHASMGEQSATDFLHYIKARADELALMELPLSDDDVIYYVLNGLGPGYHEISSTILACETSLSFDELHDKIVSREIDLKQHQNIPIQEDGKGDTPLEYSEEVIIRIPSAIVHLIDNEESVELATGEFSIVQLKQDGNVLAALARVGDEVYWPLAKDEGAVKLDQSHYFFSLTVPSESGEDISDSILNYGLTVAAKGQEGKLRELDLLLEKFSAFRVEKVASVSEQGWLGVAAKVSPNEVEKEKQEVESSASAYWTTLAPNVEDYNGKLARTIAAGSGQVMRGILWCGDVAVDRLKWGNEFLKKRVGKCSHSEISPRTLRRMQRVKKMTKMSHLAAKGLLSKAETVSGFFSSSVGHSKAGHSVFGLLSGESVRASLDGFNMVRDTIEVAGKNVMTTTSVMTTALVSQKYGKDAGMLTQDGLGAAGHALGTAYTVYKISGSVNPISIMKPTNLAKAAAHATSATLKARLKT